MATVESVTNAKLNMSSGILIVPQLNVSGIPASDSGFYEIRGMIAGYLNTNPTACTSIESYIIGLGNNVRNDTQTQVTRDIYFMTWTPFNLESSVNSDPYASIRNSGGSLKGLFYGTNGSGYPYDCFVALKDISNTPAYDKIVIIRSSDSAICHSPADYREVTFIDALNSDLSWVEFNYSNMFPITYRPTNCTFPNAPTEAAVGDTVTVQVAFTEGYGIVNNSDIYVTCNGVAVPSTYDNGALTFTMPDPSQ